MAKRREQRSTSTVVNEVAGDEVFAARTTSTLDGVETVGDITVGMTKSDRVLFLTEADARELIEVLQELLGQGQGNLTGGSGASR